MLAMVVQATPEPSRAGNVPIARHQAMAGTRTSQVAPLQQPGIESDSDRGCCVWHTREKACAYTNRKYCRTKADQQRVAFDFHKDKECKSVAGCTDKR